MDKLIISTADIKSNIERVRKQSGVQLIGNIEHGGYGCGIRFIARAYVSAGVQMFASSDVAVINEVLNDFPQISTLLTCPVIGREELECIIRRGVIATVASVSDAVRLNAAAEQADCIVKVHLLIRTHKDGCGITLSQAETAALTLATCHNLEIDGAYTYIDPSNFKKEKAVMKQKEIFDAALSIINDSGIRTPVRHMAEGYTALRYPAISYNAVRVGDAVIGRMDEKDRWGLSPVGEIETKIVGFTTIPAEEDKDIKSSKDRVFAVTVLSNNGAVYEASPDKIIPFSGKKIFCNYGKKKLRAVNSCGSSVILLDCGKTLVEQGDLVRFSADPRLVDADCVRNYE